MDLISCGPEMNSVHAPKARAFAPSAMGPLKRLGAFVVASSTSRAFPSGQSLLVSLRLLPPQDSLRWILAGSQTPARPKGGGLRAPSLGFLPRRCSVVASLPHGLTLSRPHGSEHRRRGFRQLRKSGSAVVRRAYAKLHPPKWRISARSGLLPLPVRIAALDSSGVPNIRVGTSDN